MAITPLPDPPSRADPANFAQRGDAFLAALPAFAVQANALQVDVNASQSAASDAAAAANTKAGEAAASSNSASTSAGTATTKAGEAAASATAASGSAGQARNYFEQMQGEGGVPVVAPNAIPASDIGPIYVPGRKVMTFVNGAYAPNNFPKGYRQGGRLHVDSTPGKILTVQPFALRNYDDTLDLISTSVITKTFNNVNWTIGNNGSVLIAGAPVAGNWYDIYVMRRHSDGLIDVGASLCVNGVPPTNPPNFPSGWGNARCVGSVYLDANSNLNPFMMRDREVVMITPVLIAASAAVPQLITLPMFCPPNRQSMIDITVALTLTVTAGVGVYTEGTSAPGYGGMTVGTIANGLAGSRFRIRTSAQTLGEQRNRVFFTPLGAAIPSGLYVACHGYDDSMGDF